MDKEMLSVWVKWLEIECKSNAEYINFSVHYVWIVCMCVYELRVENFQLILFWMGFCCVAGEINGLSDGNEDLDKEAIEKQLSEYERQRHTQITQR